jgi:NADH pyrophosphatase NudC (nudix superfamily)
MEQCAYRELYEELGLRREQIAELTVQQFSQPWPTRYCSLMIPVFVRLNEKLEFAPT